MEEDIAATDIICEDLISELKSGNIDPFEFATKYRQHRSNYHKRKIQLQKIREISQKAFQ